MSSRSVAPLAGVPAGEAEWRVARNHGHVAPRPVPRSCGIKSAFVVGVRALATPIVGQELELEVTVANGETTAQSVRAWLRLPDGVAAQSATEWTDALGAGQSATHRVTVRVTGVAPQAITAKARSTDPARASEPPGEGHLKLFPIEVTPGGPRAHWSATTLRALEDELPVITLKNGDRAAVIRGN